MSKSTAAYIAGFIDGEGTIKIGKSLGSYYMNLNVSNTNKEIIQWLYDSFGGRMNLTSPEQNNWKEIWRWTLYKEKGLEIFLKSISPYLKIKKRHGEIALEFIKLFDKQFYSYDRNEKGQIMKIHLRRDVKIRRDELYEEIRKLNQRGLLAR